MRLFVQFLTAFVFCTHFLNAQKIINPSLSPLLLDKAVLSGVGLDKIDLKDEPEKDFYQKNLYRGEDISVYVVSTETWNNKIDSYPFDEFVYMYHGEAFVKSARGPAQLFYSGDYFFASKGFKGEWGILAGDQLHYELSVITTRRTAADVISKDNEHLLFDKAILSGASIKVSEGSNFTKVLKAGVELTVKLEAEQPVEKALSEPSKEMLIQVLAGQISIEDNSGKKQVFNTNDFFVMPKGFTGSWKSNGHGLVKYLSVEKT